MEQVVINRNEAIIYKNSHVKRLFPNNSRHQNPLSNVNLLKANKKGAFK